MDVLNKLFEISTYSAVLLLVILAVKAVFKKKMSPAMHYLVWFLLAARLCLPVTIDSGMKFFVIQEPPAAVAAESAPVSGGSGAFTQGSSGQIPINTGDAVTQTQPGAATQPIAADSRPAPINWADILLAVWIAGMLLQVARMTVSAARMNRMICKYGVKPDYHINGISDKCHAELGIRKPVPVYLLPQIATPALTIGFFPKILLPSDLAEMLAGEQIAFSIKHELTHYKRKDHIVSIGLRVLEAVYWFNPVVWLMNKCMLADMETACDSMVVGSMDKQEKKQYVLTLLKMFSQKKTPQYLIGMALGSSEKIAEKRIRGIYMKNKSKHSVKWFAGILAAVLFVCCFTTACQPTPEKPVVVNKNDGVLQAAVSATPAPAKTFDAPKTYSDTYQRDTQSIEFNAAVEVPDTADYPVYHVKSAPFTQAEADTCAKVLMQGKPLTNNYKPLTKAQLTEQLLQVQKEQNSIKNGGKSEYGRTKESLAQLIEEIKKYIQAAPESVPDHQIVDSTLNKGEDGSQSLDVSADLGKSAPATLTLVYQPMVGGSFQFRNGDEYLADTGSDMPKGLKTTRDQAINAAEKTVADLGYSKDFAVSVITAGSSIGNSEEDVDKNRDVQGYQIFFTRRLGGIPFTYESIQATGVNTQGLKGQDEIRAAMMNAQTFEYERIIVCVDDTGVTAVQFRGMMDVMDKVNENVALLPFGDIIKTFEEQVFTHYSLTSPAYTSPQKPVKSKFDIQRITLGYTRISEKDKSGQYILVPCWDFFGSMQNEYDLDAIKKDFIDRGTDKETMEICMENYDKIQNKEVSNSYNSFITINAIDGSVIDRNLGY